LNPLDAFAFFPDMRGGLPLKRLVYLSTLVVGAVALSQGKPAEKVASGDPKPVAGVNWQGQVVKATGAGAPDLKSANPAQARLGAERAAQMDAFRNLLAQVKGIQISAGKTVGDAMAKDEIKGRVEGVIRGFKITGKRYFSDSGVEVDVEVPLAALTEVVVDDKADTALATAVPMKADGERKNTGLVVDARGLGVTPALAPRILDEAGKEVYGAKVVTAEARKSSGVASYVQSVEEAKKSMKAGDKPLIIKATKANGSDLVLGADDVKKLAEANNSYLAEGRVVIVTN
jgi:hypothetical protein